jgi:hypothetical protein
MNDKALDFEPLERPEQWANGHTDEAFIEDDARVGDALAWAMGELDPMDRVRTPREQWRNVARALRVHGLRIANRSMRHPIAGLPEEPPKKR